MKERTLWRGIDSGAQRKVIGVPQATVYCGIPGIDFKKLPGRTLQFKFGEAAHGELGSVEILLPLVSDYCVAIQAYIVNVNVLLLVGLDVLSKLWSVIDFADESHAARDGSGVLISPGNLDISTSC